MIPERGRKPYKATFAEADFEGHEDGDEDQGASRRSASMPSRSPNGGVRPRAMEDKKFKTQNELKLIEIVVGLLEDQTMNPYKGSVPVERIQNVVRSQYNHLYNLIVGSRHNSWKRFLEYHPKVFHLFCVDDGKWRMRLVRHCDWREADLQEQEERQSKEFHLISCLATYLRMQPNFSCRVDDFRVAYPNLPQNQPREPGGNPPYPLPARGDLTRFVRRHPTHFIYDKDNFSIILKQLKDENP
jgi:hypothetical protein